jgi:predicted Holliday junction resolvase-like endonuclease
MMIIMMMIIIIIIIIIITQLILGENCYIASTQWKLKDTQQMRFSTPRNIRYKRELNLGTKRRRRRRRTRRRRRRNRRKER